jgi:hypothetical protein
MALNFSEMGDFLCRLDRLFSSLLRWAGQDVFGVEPAATLTMLVTGIASLETAPGDGNVSEEVLLRLH